MSKFVLSGDFSAYKSGDYTVFNNVWGKGSLVNGTDFYQSVTFDSTHITTGVTFSWSWPVSTTGMIVAYPEITWGDSPFYDGSEETHTYVSKISDLRSFAVDLDLDVTSGAQYCNLSFDLFLTNKPLGDQSSITTEVMIWVDNQSTSIWGSKVGTFTDGSHSASIYFYDGGSSADYIAVVFDKPWLDGSIDIKKVLSDLGAKGLLSTSDYVSGHQFGAEITGGSGSFTINSISTTFKTNHGPTLASSVADQSVSEDAGFLLQLPAGTFSDADGDTLTYAATLGNGHALPSWLTFDAATRTFLGTPINEDVGTITVKVTASDGMVSVSDVFDITVSNTNDAPTVAIATADQTALEDSSFHFQIPDGTFSDADGDELTYTATLADGAALPSWLKFDAGTRVFSGTPLNGDVGVISVKVVASDAVSAVFSVFHITVQNTNDAPTLATAIADQSATENSAFQFRISSGTFLDADGDTLNYSATLANGHALPSWLTFDPATGVFSGTPSQGDVGSISVRVTAGDGTASVSETFSISVAGINHAPTDIQLSNASINENSAPGTIVGTLNGTDGDGDSLSFSLVDGDNGVFRIANGNIVLAEGANLDFETTSVYSVTVRAADSAGLYVDKVFDVTVLDVDDSNHAPTVVSALPNQMATESSVFRFQFSNGAFADSDGDTLIYGATLANGKSLPAWLSFDAATHTFSGTPAHGDVGSISVKVTASDGIASVSDTFDISVAGINHAPTSLQLSNASIKENSAAGTVVGTLTGVDDGGSDLSFSLVGGDNGVFNIVGKNIVLAGGANLDFETKSSYSVTVRATDAGGLYLDKAVTIKVTDVAENRAPVVANPIADQVATEGSRFKFGIPVTAIVDLDGDKLTYSATLVNGKALPSWLTFDTATRVFFGTPGQNDVGSISVRLTASDGTASASDTFSVSVGGINHAPEEISLSNASISESASAGKMVGRLSAVDSDHGDKTTFTLLGSSDQMFAISGNKIVLAAGKSLDYEVKNAFTVTVRATDEAGAGHNETFKIKVTSQPIDGNEDNNALHGSFKHDILRGFDGDDRLEGRGGADKLYGGSGEDTASYRNSDRSVSASLLAPDQNRGDARGDTYVSIENLEGSNYADKLTGNRGSNELDGGKGNDVLTGGAGADVFVFGKGYGHDRITDFEARGSRHDFIDLSNASGIIDFSDLVLNHIRTTGDNLVITASDGSRLVLEDIHSAAELIKGDFLF